MSVDNPDTLKTVEDILREFSDESFDAGVDDVDGYDAVLDQLVKSAVEAINALRRADEAKWSEDIFNRAKAGEVVKIERDGITYHLSTFEGMVDGQQRVVDAALTLGVEIGRHKRKDRLNG